MSQSTEEEDDRKLKMEADIREMEVDDISSVYHLGEKLFTNEEFPILYRTWDAFEVTESFTSDPTYCLVAEVEKQLLDLSLLLPLRKKALPGKNMAM